MRRRGRTAGVFVAVLLAAGGVSAGQGGWGSGTGRVDHQVALLTRRRHRVSVAIFTQFDPDHAYGKRTLRGVASRLLAGLSR